MVVDDNADIIAIVKTILEASGHAVITAGNGEELLNRLQEVQPHLILLDIMMPVMDGLQALKQLKGNPETSSIPVILLTAKVQYEDVLTGYKHGAGYYLTKPFGAGQLLNAVNLVLGLA